MRNLDYETAIKYAAEIETDSRLLDLPDIRQHYTYDCGAAATMSAGKYFSVGPDKLSEWHKILHTSESTSTTPDNIIKYLTELGLDVNPQQNMTLEELRQCWFDNKPVLCPIKEYSVPSKESSEKYGHWVCVIGVALGYVFVQDPSYDNTLENEDSDAAPGRMIITYDTWNKVWHDNINGKQYTKYGIIVSR